MAQCRTGFRDIALKNFSITRMRILIELADRGSMWNHEMAEILGLNSDTCSETLARMARDGEVQRVRSLSDSGCSKFRYSLSIAGREQMHRTYRHATGREFFQRSFEATALPAPASATPVQQAG